MLSVEDIKSWVAQALRSIYKGLKGKIEPNLFELESQNIIDAVETGMGFEYNKPNFDLSLKLAQSGLWFAARKSYAEANDLAALLANNGTKRSWSEFKKLAAPIVGKYNQTWLRTEYTTAARAARVAAIWKDIERTADLYPNVEYLRTRSANPREEHLKYVGIIRPINDPFWDTHTPPLSWRCKCSIRSTDQAITDIPADLPKPAEGLQNNPARSEQLFTESHPYAQNAKAVEETLRTEFNQLRAQMGLFFKVKTPKNGLVLVHPSHEDNDVPKNLPTAIFLADKGYKTTLPLHSLKDGDSKPDLTVNNQLADLKEPASDPKNIPKDPYKSIKKLIDDGSEKIVGTDRVRVLVFRFEKALVAYTEDDMKRGLPRSFINNGKLINTEIEKLIFIDTTGKIVELTREYILANGINDEFKNFRFKQ